jgi:uncharacterized protein (TIRG00374 family)
MPILSKAMKKIKVFLFVLGLLLLALFIRKLGLENIWSNLRTLGWKFGLILGLSASWHCLNTITWGLALVETQHKSRFRRLFCARLAGEAVNCITPIINLGGEPLKAYLLRNQIPLPDGIASVVIDRTVHTLSGIAFVSFGVGLAITRLSIPISVKIALICSMSLYTIGAVLGVIIQQRKPAVAFLGLLHRLKIKFPRLEAKREGAILLDTRLIQFYRKHKFRFSLMFTLRLLAWTLGVFEVWLILSFWAVKVNFSAAFLINTLTLIINVAFAFIPLSLGASEGGQVFIFMALGLTPGFGLSLGIVRRLRMLSWVLSGLILLLIKQKPGF